LRVRSAFALPFFAIALKAFDRRGGSAEDGAIPSIDGARSLEHSMAKNNSDEPRTLEIRKYQNRRYYDSTRSRHLSLQQIHKLIIEGYNIRVLDAKTNEDITPKVLTQILLEYEPVKLDMFSNELLTRAIRVNDRLLKDFVDVYFRQAFEAFCGSQKREKPGATPFASSQSPNLPLRRMDTPRSGINVRSVPRISMR
jgi:polyhydroxyalkanoate synthesis repressor PhaR